MQLTGQAVDQDLLTHHLQPGSLSPFQKLGPVTKVELFQFQFGRHESVQRLIGDGRTLQHLPVTLILDRTIETNSEFCRQNGRTEAQQRQPTPDRNHGDALRKERVEKPGWPDWPQFQTSQRGTGCQRPAVWLERFKAFRV